MGQSIGLLHNHWDWFWIEEVSAVVLWGNQVSLTGLAGAPACSIIIIRAKKSVKDFCKL